MDCNVEKNQEQLSDVKNFWENVNENFAHLTISGYLGDYKQLVEFWESNFINMINWENSSVLDYGIGGGYLGKYLFDNKHISKYYGVDISQRSLAKAQHILANANAKLMDVDEFYDNFAQKINVFVSQACIQHFPDKKYLVNFLNKINNIEPDVVMLQIAHNSECKFIDANKYKTIQDVVRSCYTNPEFIMTYLTKYQLTYKSDILPNNYQFLIMKLNR